MIDTLRDHAILAQDELIRFNLNVIAAELEHAVAAFTLRPTADNLIAVNGHWAHGTRMIDHAKRDNAERQARRPTNPEQPPCSTIAIVPTAPPTTC